MNRIEKLKQQIKALDAKIDAILAGDDLTAEQQAEHDRLVAERTTAVEQLRKAIADEEGRSIRAGDLSELEKRANAIADAAARRPAGTGRKVHTSADGSTVGEFEETDEVLTVRFGDTRDAVQRLSYEEQKKANLRLLRTSGYKPWGEFRSAKEFIRAGLDGSGTQRFEDRVNRHYAAVSGMSEGVGSDGGYTVMPEFAAGIIDRIYANDLWSRTDNYNVTGNNLTFLANAETNRAAGSRHGGLRGYWLAEGGSITSSKPTLREVSIKLVKLGVVVYLTNELISDSGVALEQYIARKAAEEFNFMIGDALVNGTGVGQPLGMLLFPSLVSIAKETAQPAATLVTENVVKMYSRFYAPGLPRAVWLHNQDIQPQLDLMTLAVGAAGIATYMPPGGLSAGPYATLRGRPMIPTEFSATLGTQGDLILADMSQILSISKGGVAQAVSMHVQFLTDQQAVRFTLRLNATPWENAPITPYKGTGNTQSNFVTLDARS